MHDNGGGCDSIQRRACVQVRVRASTKSQNTRAKFRGRKAKYRDRMHSIVHLDFAELLRENAGTSSCCFSSARASERERDVWLEDTSLAL